MGAIVIFHITQAAPSKPPNEIATPFMSCNRLAVRESNDTVGEGSEKN